MKKIKFILLGIFLIIIVGILILYRKQTVAVLGYHSFATTKEIKMMKNSDNMIMDIQHFEEQLNYLEEHNYKTLTLDEFYCFMEGECTIPRKSVLITMDDGYQSNYDLAFPLLKKHHMYATVFYIGNNEQNESLQYMNMDIVEKAKKEYPNIEFASHSYQLHEPGAIEKGKDILYEDFNKMSQILDTKYFAYPYGISNADIKEILKEKNFQLAFGFGPGKKHRKASQYDDKYDIPRLNISNDMPLWKFILRIKMPY